MHGQNNIKLLTTFICRLSRNYRSLNLPLEEDFKLYNSEGHTFFPPSAQILRKNNRDFIKFYYIGGTYTFDVCVSVHHIRLTHIYVFGFDRHYRPLRTTGRYFRRYTAEIM